MVTSHYHLLFALEISEEHCEHLKYRKAKKKGESKEPQSAAGCCAGQCCEQGSVKLQGSITKRRSTSPQFAEPRHSSVCFLSGGIPSLSWRLFDLFFTENREIPRSR